MAHPHRLLVFGASGSEAAASTDRLRNDCEFVITEDGESTVRALQDESITGFCVLGNEASQFGGLLEAGGILHQLPDGVALLNVELSVIWANSKLQEDVESDSPLVDRNFYDIFGSPEIMGPDFCPFRTALGTGESAKSTLRIGEKKYLEVHAKPIFESISGVANYLVVLVRDISSEILQQQKLSAIYQAGLELGDLSPLELMEMSVGERVELLKSKILHYTKDLLEFDTVEIRLVDKRTKQLSTLLAVGMEKMAADRKLFADPQGNGVTGFVAATGKSYLCEDTGSDPLYLPGAPDARSSLTVPLILHDEILGTFNVESPFTSAFNENDLQFLELFSREVAVALNTLELLATEKMTTATESIELVLREVAKPVDEILNDTARILERYIGHDSQLTERLNKVLKHTRDIKQLIQKVGKSITPVLTNSPLPPRPQRPKLLAKRILVVDSDDAVRRAAHELLGRFGCEVEAVPNGEEALLMVRSFHYDAVIADIRLPDMTGFECFKQLLEMHEHLPVILMTGYGYDPTHSIVNARQMGLKSVLYKPFRLDQLLDEVESAVSIPRDLSGENKPNEG